MWRKRTRIVLPLNVVMLVVSSIFPHAPASATTNPPGPCEPAEEGEIRTLSGPSESTTYQCLCVVEFPTGLKICDWRIVQVALNVRASNLPENFGCFGYDASLFEDWGHIVSQGCNVFELPPTAPRGSYDVCYFEDKPKDTCNSTFYGFVGSVCAPPQQEAVSRLNPAERPKHIYALGPFSYGSCHPYNAPALPLGTQPAYIVLTSVQDRRQIFIAEVIVC